MPSGVWWHCLPQGCPCAGTQVQSDREAALELLLTLGRGSESQGKNFFYLLQNPPALGSQLDFGVALTLPCAQLGFGVHWVHRAGAAVLELTLLRFIWEVEINRGLGKGQNMRGTRLDREVSNPNRD